MRLTILLATIIFIALSTAAMAIEIADEPPTTIDPNLLATEEGPRPIDTTDESSMNWVPKGDLGLTLNQATKGLEKIIPEVSRLIYPSGAPGFSGQSEDGQISLFILGDESAIKTLHLTLPFCVDPYRFSLGSWSDSERPVAILTSCLDGVFPSLVGAENHEWIRTFVKNMLSRPLRNFKNDGVEAVDGCVLFRNQAPVIRKVSAKAEVTLSSSDFGHEFTLEITPHRKPR